jgi:hypothetical protein
MLFFLFLFFSFASFDLKPSVVSKVCEASSAHSCSKWEIAKRDAFSKNFVSLIKNRTFSQDVMQKALEDLLTGGHIHLLRPDLGKNERTLNDLLQESENQWIRSFLMAVRMQGASSEEINFSDPEKVMLCKQELVALVLENISRPPKTIAGYTQTISKGIGRLDLAAPSSCFIENEGYPSFGDDDKKGLPCRFLPHCANLGVVKGPKGNCVIARSGKANSKERMLECVVHACLGQLQSSSPVGFSKTEDGTLEFQHVITSYINTLVTTEKDKSKNLLSLVQAIDAWPQEGVKIAVGDQKIILKQPIFQNQMFSTILDSINSTESETGLDRADYLTFAGNQRLLEKFIDKEKIEVSEDFLNASRKLDELLVATGITAESCLGDNRLIVWKKVSIRDLYLNRSKIFKEAAFEEYQMAVASFLLKEKQRGILPQAIFALLFRRDMVEILDHNFTMKPSHDKELHAADVDLYRNIVCQQLNLSQGKQCARGLDRTGIGVALAVAQDRYLHDQGAIFLPATGVIVKGSDKHQNLIQFKRYFREAFEYLGVPMGVESRGKSGIGSIKDDNPIEKKYLISEEDIGFGFPEVTKEEIDVYNVLYTDLAHHSKRQYGGVVTDRFIYSIAGQHIKRTEALVEGAIKNITPAIRNHVETRIKEMLQATGWKDESAALLLNSSLELDLSISELKLHELVGNKTRLEMLETQLYTHSS